MLPSFYRLIALAGLAARSAVSAPGPVCEPWTAPYEGGSVTGRGVIACWLVRPDAPLEDAGPHALNLALAGASIASNGRFGPCLQPTDAPQDRERRHAARAPNHPALSPPGAFTIEAWICPGPAWPGTGEAFLVDKKYADDADYQLVIGDERSGQRSLIARLGFGDGSESFISEPAVFPVGVWRHVAFVYNGRGRGRFFIDGSLAGVMERPGCGGIAPGRHGLSIGDRVGSYHHAFPGRIAQVRLCADEREFRLAALGLTSDRRVFVRCEESPELTVAVTNLTGRPFPGATLTLAVGDATNAAAVDPAATAAAAGGAVRFNTRLRPDSYPLTATLAVATDPPWTNSTTFEIRLVPRPPPIRMPVIMWGAYSAAATLDELPRLKDLGFTHCLGVRADYERLWATNAITPPSDDEQVALTRRILDEALAADFSILASLSPNSALQGRAGLGRVDRRGAPVTNRPNLCATAPAVRDYGVRLGESVARAYGAFPAFDGALLNTEVRDAAQICWHEHDRATAARAGFPAIPEGVSKAGIRWNRLPDFPSDRVVEDDHPVLAFLRWWWKHGDGWNDLNTAIREGLHRGGVRPGFWTFHDPAARVASVWGSGGDVDVLSQWTYSYPDPIRIGLATDELFAMARGAGRPQRVMKMTQVIWYRSQTAPQKASDAARVGLSPWEDTDPDAAFLTIAPMHLREAFWTKIARPIDGIMYHGWQSLVPCRGSSSYRFTHPETRHELRRLVRTVVEPLGPTLRQVPDAPADVAMLESFAAQMFAGRGTYGWGRGWAADAWHILAYAHLQPEIVYDETVLRDGLDRFRVLVAPDCDVVTRGVADRIRAFQRGGGLLIGDERLAPGLTADLALPVTTRTGRAREDHDALIAQAAQLVEWISGRYQRRAWTSRPTVLPRLRRYRDADYLFLVNDRREYGAYVGRHQLVMEAGLPDSAEVCLRRPGGRVYDLLDHAPVPAEVRNGVLRFQQELGPCEGRVFLVCDAAIAGVRIRGPSGVPRGGTADVRLSVIGDDGRPLAAVVPVRVEVRDPDGREAEGTGWYGARDGELDLRVDIAPNDTAGAWEVRVRELASNRSAAFWFQVSP